MQNEYRKIEKNSYTIEYNEATGEIAGIYDRLNPGANWKAEADDKKLGTIFIHGTQSREDEIPFAEIENMEKGFKETMIYICIKLSESFLWKKLT